jgi:hypothetical protein
MNDGQSASPSWCQATFRAHDQLFFLLEIFFRQLQVYFVAPFLTWGWVCNLLLLLGLASAVPLGSETRRTWPYFIVPISETPPTWRARPPYLYPPVTGCPSYTPGHWVPFFCLLWLTGLRWKYSNPPPHGIIDSTMFWFFKYSLGTDPNRTLLPTIPLLLHTSNIATGMDCI